MLSDELASRLSDLLAARLGLHFPANRRRELEQGLRGAAREHGHGSEAEFARWLLTGPLTRSRLEMLATHLTIGETYFFREPQVLDALEQRVLAELIDERRESGKQLRIWSAGCCSGEEAYTIAMLIDRLIPDQEEWEISIIGTDVNPAFLRKAAAGVYRKWSFRRTPEWIKSRFFRKRSGELYELTPEIRARVEFRSLNLAEDSYPSASNGIGDFDLILCRNVLMYFSPESASAVVDRLHRSLVPGGWLATSATEASTGLFGRFEAVPEGKAILFRRGLQDEPHLTAAGVGLQGVKGAAQGGRPGSQPAPVRTARRLPGLEQGGGEKPQRSRPTRGEGHRRSTAGEEGGPSGSEEQRQPVLPEGDAAEYGRAAREHADHGRLDEALESCRRAVEFDSLNPAYRYLLATIELERGREEEGSRALTQALYLDPDVALPHVALANLRRAQGRFSESARHFQTALRLLRELPKDELIAESNGLTAYELVQMVEAAHASLAFRAKVARPEWRAEA